MRSTRPSTTAAVVATVRARARLARPASRAGSGDAADALARDLRLRIPAHRNRTFVAYLAGRTRFFDGVVAGAVERPGTVVLVGAGYDDRSMRFRTPGVRFVEVDHPLTQRDKRARLARLGIDVTGIDFVEADLERDSLDEVLAAAGVAGVDPGTDGPVTFVCEALLPYLSRPAVEATLGALARAAPGASSTLAVDVPVQPSTVRGRAAVAFVRTWTAATGEPVRTVFATEPDAIALLGACGWGERSRTTGRELDMPAAARESLFLELAPLHVQDGT